MDINDLRRIADLSRLSFSDDELAAFALQFDSIVDYVSAINALDRTGVEPQTHVNETTNVFRDDVVGATVSTKDALANAPRKNDAFIKVPRVLGS